VVLACWQHCTTDDPPYGGIGLSNESALLLLRLTGSTLLLLFLLAIFLVLWRDYRGTTAQIEASRRSHGRLVQMQAVDDHIVVMPRTYPLLPLTSIGRSPTNTIPIDEQFASGEHALIALRAGTWWLEDRNSRNGTLLNDNPVKQPIVITDGDVIGIGKLKFRIDLET